MTDETDIYFGKIEEDEENGLKALYSVPEFARLCRMDRWTVARLLESAGVTFVGVGRTRRIPLSEIAEKLPALYRSVLLLQESE